MPDSLDDLDLLLMTVSNPEPCSRDGIHFQGLRYIDPTMAAYVGEAVTIRYRSARPIGNQGFSPQ